MGADDNGDREVRTLEVRVEGGKVRAELQPDEIESEPCDLRLDSLKRDTINTLVGILRENRLLPAEYEVLGANLYSVIFGNEKIAGLFKDALETGDDLRIELRFEDDDSELAGWPWEYLFHPKRYGEMGSGQFLAQRTKLVLTRRLRADRHARKLRVKDADLPLKVLFVAPSPADLDPVLYSPALDQLRDLEEELNRPQRDGEEESPRLEVVELVDPEQVPGQPELERVVTWTAFTKQVDAINPHLIHFVGHGHFRDRAGWIAFDKTDGMADWVKDESFGNHLEPLQTLRLVFVQACESGQAGVNPYQAASGVAMQLAHRNIPAVVAMQYRIQNEIANRFAKRFYTALAEPMAIDLAVRAGRLEIGARPEELGAPVLGLPVLYLREYGALWGPRITPTQTGAVRGAPPSASVADAAAVPNDSHEAEAPTPRPAPPTVPAGDAPIDVSAAERESVAPPEAADSDSLWPQPDR